MFQDTPLSAASVEPTSEFHRAVILVLLMVANYMVQGKVHDVHYKFNENPLIVSKGIREYSLFIAVA
jgi:hypothetical protein